MYSVGLNAPLKRGRRCFSHTLAKANAKANTNAKACLRVCVCVCTCVHACACMRSSKSGEFCRKGFLETCEKLLRMTFLKCVTTRGLQVMFRHAFSYGDILFISRFAIVPTHLRGAPWMKRADLYVGNPPLQHGRGTVSNLQRSTSLIHAHPKLDVFVSNFFRRLESPIREKMFGHRSGQRV